MTLQTLLNSIPFVINLIIVGTYIIGTSAALFGLYDRFHLHWTGDLKAMITALTASAIILITLNIIKNGPIISNAMLFTYIFLIAATYFTTQLCNPKLNHGKHKPKP
jgi:hypothetical protein